MSSDLQKYITFDHNKSLIFTNTVADLESIALNVKSLSRDFFEKLGPWILYLNENKEGFALRIGNSKPMPSAFYQDCVYLCFYNFINLHNYSSSDKEIRFYLDKIKVTIMDISNQIAARNKNSRYNAFLFNETPEWMMQDLIEILNKDSY